MLTFNRATVEFFSYCLHEKNLSGKAIKFFQRDIQQFWSYIKTNSLASNKTEG